MYQSRQGVHQLQECDERTWQVGLAPLAKNKVLKELTLTDLNPIFYQSFGSGNPSLLSYLDNRFRGQSGSLTFGNRIMPCVFQDTNAKTMVYAPPSGATNLEIRQLYFADVIFQTNPAKEMEAVATVKSLLDSVQGYQPETADWSAAYYADLAVKACLRQNQPALAKAILLRGLQLEPASDQLAYLSRILLRAGILTPAELPANSPSLGK